MPATPMASVGRTTLAAAFLAAVLGGCGDSGRDSLALGPDPQTHSADPSDGGPADGGAAPFEAVGPRNYVPRVKNLMTGLAATDAEVNAVVKDPSALRGLVDEWMTLPEFRGRMLDFFRNAFQQNQVTAGALVSNLGYRTIFGGAPGQTADLERNLMDSFPLTVWELVKNGQPLNAAITTNQYMLTTAMMSFLSLADDLSYDDAGNLINRPALRNAIPGFSVDPNESATLAETLDPSSSKYMKWGFTDIRGASPGRSCATAKPAVYGANYGVLAQFLWGTIQPDPCTPGGSGPRINLPTQFAATDYTDWRMVTLHGTDATTPNTTPVFFDVLKLRAAQALTLHTQRIGFFGTLAFDTNWGTNVTNEARVTANQSLIVAIGQSINGEDTIVHFPVDATDGAHATNPACTGCHAQLDPFKQYFRQSYSLSYHDQTDATQVNAPAGFAIDGVTVNGGTGVSAIAATLASHPRFPLAWAGKLHFWATSTAALEDDPELVRIANAFNASNLDFKTLARELFTSPLITLASGTKTTLTNGVVLSIARRDQLCTSLSNRLGLPDVCGAATPVPSAAQKNIASRAALLPVDTYYRAYALPSLPTNPDLFFRDTVEGICALVANQLIDLPTGTSRYDSTKPDVAIADFVATVMNIAPSDPRSAQMVGVLEDNFTAGKAAGSNATDSLKATFTLACIAPTSVVVGL